MTNVFGCPYSVRLTLNTLKNLTFRGSTTNVFENSPFFLTLDT